jgi:hypothetical protein
MAIKLYGETQEIRVSVIVCVDQVIEENLTGFTHLRRDLGEPDDRLYRLHLAEERLDATERVVPPVLKETGRFGRNVPVAGVRTASPLVYVTAETVYY